MSTSIKIAFSFIFAFAFKAQAETAIRIAYPAAGTIASAQIGLIFEKTDILKKHGLKASVVSIGTGRELKPALVSGRTDVILTSQSNFVVLLGEGFPAKALNSLGSAGRLALVVKKDSTVRTLADLKGQTIATIFGTSLHQPSMQWASEAGAKVVNISQVGALHAALESGAVAGVLTYDPFLTELEAAGKVRIVREDKFDLITVVSGKYADAHGAEVRALNESFKDAILYLRSHRSEVNAWFSERAKLSVEAIDKSSRFNDNYAGAEKAPVQLQISSKFAQKLQQEGEFLFKEKVIKLQPSIAPNILSTN